MSRQEWVDLANNLFDSFGDVVRDAVVQISVQGAYDPTTGGYAKTTTNVDTKAFFTKVNKRFVPDGVSYSILDKFVKVRGSDFVSAPKTGDIITMDSIVYKIKEILPDESETGAYFDLRVTL